MDKRKVILTIIICTMVLALVVNCVSAVKTEKTKLYNSNTRSFDINNGKISNHITCTNNFEIKNILKGKTRLGYTPYTGYLKVKAYNKNVKIKKITVQLYGKNRGIYYKTFNGNNKNSQTITLGRMVTANVHDLI